MCTKYWLTACLFKLAQEKVWLGEMTVPPMTIAVDLDKCIFYVAWNVCDRIPVITTKAPTKIHLKMPSAKTLSAAYFPTLFDYCKYRDKL